MSSDGRKRWVLNTKAAIVATMLAEDGTVYVLNVEALIAVSPEGKLLTKNAIPEILEPPRTQVIATSLKERRVLTKIPFDTSVSPSPTLAPDGTIYVGSHGGKIVALAGTHGGLMNSPWPKFQGDLANSGRSPAPNAEGR
ncbi:MAG TPA: PQQ-binding-like beta-propeller repeat protein [Candidatus Angelobacter sp.]|nr:PQQ-binding-like beta-propeller repeat protein [Candidatus Angelobacter sp.]